MQGLPVAPTFLERWTRAVAAVPTRPFLVFEDRAGAVHAWTYAEFDGLAGEIAATLAGHGVAAGDRVHVALANSPAIVAAWLACVRAGAVFVPSDPRASRTELEQHAALTRPTVGIYARDRAADPPDGAAARLIVAEDDADVGALRGDDAAGAERQRPEQPAAILFTSGTTSAPKGVVVTQANYAFAGEVMASAAALTRDDRYLVVLPVFHANAQYYCIAAAICVGASVALTAGFSASRFLGQAAAHEATHLSLFAAPIRMILARGATAVEGLRVRHCWYAQNLNAAQLERFAALIGCRPRQLYGMTETLPAVLTQHPLDSEPGVMGEATLGCRVELLPVDAETAPAPGEVGEIAVRGVPGRTLFAGYFENPEATRRALRDGLLRTGDLATVDDAGRFRFAGRLGDRLKVAGETVSTVEVEEALADHPGVLEAAVVGRPDEIHDEVPVAYVVRSPASPAVTAAQLAAYAASRLAPAKRPREIAFVDELPRTSVGKVRKFALVESSS